MSVGRRAVSSGVVVSLAPIHLSCSPNAMTRLPQMSEKDANINLYGSTPGSIFRLVHSESEIQIPEKDTDLTSLQPSLPVNQGANSCAASYNVNYTSG